MVNTTRETPGFNPFAVRLINLPIKGQPGDIQSHTWLTRHLGYEWPFDLNN